MNETTNSPRPARDSRTPRSSSGKSGLISLARLATLAAGLFLAASLVLAACRPAAPSPESAEPTPAALVEKALAAPLPSPTPEPVQLEPSPTPTASLPELLPTPTLEPLRFVFPTPGPAPVSAWRPPLYPTPWAPTPYDHFFFARPIAADEINWPLADYRYGGVFFENVVHTGVDIPAEKGAPILAAGSGKVTWAGYGLYYQKEDLSDPYGLAVAIKHDFGYQGETIYTVYGHMDQVFVTRGQQVNGGDLIGLVGETGQVTGPHLHFEVRMGKNNFFGSRNPELWMSPPQGWGVLAARVTDSWGEPLVRQLIKLRNRETGQKWDVYTYGEGSTNSDPYYRENAVIGDLPAGPYEVWFSYLGRTESVDVEIHPGLVTYFTFRGSEGFDTSLPEPPAEFTPAAPEIPLDK